MLLICYYRGMINGYKDSELITKLLKKIENADVIIAPTADNRMFHIMNEFALGNITSETTMHSLSASQLGRQYVLRSDKAIESLKLIERLYLCDEEKKIISKHYL